MRLKKQLTLIICDSVVDKDSGCKIRIAVVVEQSSEEPTYKTGDKALVAQTRVCFDFVSLSSSFQTQFDNTSWPNTAIYRRNGVSGGKSDFVFLYCTV